jgi:C1A family cysteine protease
LPPAPDTRDYTVGHTEVGGMMRRLGLAGAKRRATLSAKTDLRSYCSPIEDQRGLGSCTAHAAVGVVEYFERRAFGKHIDGSRLFVYKVTRNLMQVTGDTGAWLRNTMGALVHCGVPAEKYWPYTDADPAFDREPEQFVYAVADEFKAVRYFCHDPLGGNASTTNVLTGVKRFLAAGVPSMFGFWGFPSSDQGDVRGAIPYPCAAEQAIWGHAVVAVGYDDKLKITNRQCNRKTTGALLIRNSWGPRWGDAGYGWLPYQYVIDRLALDFWSLLSMDWVDTKKFGI